MSDIEALKKKLELSKVSVAREEMELRIYMKREEIESLEQSILAQKKREEELKEELGLNN